MIILTAGGMLNSYERPVEASEGHRYQWRAKRPVETIEFSGDHSKLWKSDRDRDQWRLVETNVDQWRLVETSGDQWRLVETSGD